MLFSTSDSLVFFLGYSLINHRVGSYLNATEWRTFIDASKRSLKAVLLHNGDRNASVPVDHSVQLKESYGNLSMFLKNINEHK